MAAQLLPELLVEIFEHFIPSDELDDRGVYTDLRSFSLVCRGWREYAQRALFAALLLHGDGDVRAEDWLSSSAQARTHTRHLSIYDSPAMDSKVLAVCSGLTRLTSLFAAGRESGYDVCMHPSALGVKKLTMEYPDKYPINATPLPQQLQSLTLVVNHIVSDATFTSIFQSSIHTLTSLSLICDDKPVTVATLATFLRRVEPSNLRSLSVEDWADEESFSDIITALPGLKSLTIELYGLIAVVGRCAPPQLEVLTIRGNDFPDDLDPFLNELLFILRPPKLATLRQLRLPTVPKSKFAGPSGIALMEECEERSISLLCRYGYLTVEMLQGEKRATEMLQGEKRTGMKLRRRPAKSF